MKSESINPVIIKPEVYYFIKYDKETTLQQLIKKSIGEAELCFDLEDSAFDWINESNSILLKAEKRIALSNILLRYKEELKNVKIGVRVNSPNSSELTKDITALSQFENIHSIFIPKVNSVFDFENYLNNISSQNINYKEIIPVIETKNGIENLNELLRSFPQIKKVCFGHCDYNLDVKVYPFFHQDSLEYWKWVNVIVAIAKQFKVKFINSPYLDLNNTEFFKSILSHLNFITKGEFGQITLNSRQTLICDEFNGEEIPINGVAKERHNFNIKKHDLEFLINKFEKENTGVAFTLTDANTIISPQEYCASKYFLKENKYAGINLTFVGGCFPVQHNILVEDTFHRLLKTKLEENYNLNLNFNIIRYERFSNCLDKIITQNKIQPIDYLVFHIRAEPFLRLIKLFYKYQDYEYNKHWSLNIPFRKRSDPEKYDMMLLARRYIYSEEKNRSKFYKLFIDMNYFLGWAAGNNGYALKKYSQLVNSVIEYCKENKIKLYILGPAIRSNTFMEKIISGNLENYFSEQLTGMKEFYISGLYKNEKDDVKYFNENGTHATEKYHELIAERLYGKIQKSFDKNDL